MYIVTLIDLQTSIFKISQSPEKKILLKMIDSFKSESRLTFRLNLSMCINLWTIIINYY